MAFMDEMLPETAEAFGKMRETIFQGGELDRKTKELIAVACSALMRCQYCVYVHSQRAIDHGANNKEIAEAISVAMFIAAGSQLGWTNDLGKSAYDLIFEDERPKESGEGCCCGR
ncbi:MAG: Alkyl hydroperoxide reductase AhpD [Methanosaeta sp. PtaU1.Bin060]|nr:MAG: Alkyl hydroperoxide reductase AhpD [Methanosaeta sp. PtaU1.Bin060]